MLLWKMRRRKAIMREDWEKVSDAEMVYKVRMVGCTMVCGMR